MRARLTTLAVVVFVATSCATTVPPSPQPEVLHGVASWYGQEFAGRTTANGEIFDPNLLTAAHRTLPFGTVVDVTNPRAAKTIRVRINDRGPYVGNRVIDLSYAAAKEIDLIEPGSGEVDIAIVKLGRGEREPPVPLSVAITPPKEKPAAGDPPPVEFPLPSNVAKATPPPPVTSVPAGENDFSVQVVEEHGGQEVRRRVSADGKSVEVVPVASGAAPLPSSPGRSAAASLDARQQRTPRVTTSTGPARFVVQVGAFSVEANARSLQERLGTIGHRAYVDSADLFRVRIGPFSTRDEALRAREKLESTGISALVMPE